MNSKSSNSLAFTGCLTAISASLCCITPVLALFAGSTGIASTFSWVEPFRSWLIGFTILVLAAAWYQKLRPETEEEMYCACEQEKQDSFWQSKKLLGLATVFAALMLVFPYYADGFYPKPIFSELGNTHQLATYQINIKGMTCNGCEEHVKAEISKLQGISSLEVSYEQANALVTFDESLTDIEQVNVAIYRTGYTVESHNKSK